MSRPSLVWFRRDLRLADQPALQAAIDAGRPVIPVFIQPDDKNQSWPTGGASQWWLHQSLANLNDRLQSVGSKLILRRGPVRDVLLSLVKETDAAAVFWNRRYEPENIELDKRLKAELKESQIDVVSTNGHLLFEPWEVQSKDGKPYQVYTAFWKACLKQASPAEPLPPPKRIAAPKSWPESLSLDGLRLMPRIVWYKGMESAWSPGEASAHKELDLFLKSAVTDYAGTRNFPAVKGTSRLSPHLHFGEISPRTIWHETIRVLRQRFGSSFELEDNQFLKEIVWREFAYHLLFHFPRTPNEPLREQYAKFPWQEDPEQLKAWQKGMTGYPIVDAGMRELWHTGWMHNRVRMIVASFLIKDLLIPWQRGAEWFWDTLVDADLASNTLNWQWNAGCGADAAPFFRIFNPVLQSKKFDTDGEYIYRWVPELAKLSAEWIHEPWAAPTEVLHKAGITLGETYPLPIVDHDEARQLALKALAAIKEK